MYPIPKEYVKGLIYKDELENVVENLSLICLKCETSILLIMQHDNYITECFYAVAYKLQDWAKATDMTYNEINIIVYYLIVPLTWTILFDIGLRLPIATPILLLLWLCIWLGKRKHFRAWCDVAFNISVRFLLSFKRVGWNYEKSSVIICVVVPIIIYVLLILWAIVS